ncbi:hypothetical protein KJ782_04495 [Patescibacteria group bacterium]|nr:hypothetical protein [Patescibacteria group bacterium]
MRGEYMVFSPLPARGGHGATETILKIMDQIFNKKEYIYLGQYKTPLIYNWLLQNWADNKTGKRYGLPKLDGRLLLLDGHLFICKKDWEKIEEWTRKTVEEKNNKSFESIFKLTKEKTDNMLSIAKKLQENKGLNIGNFGMFFKTMNEMEYPWFFMLPMNDELEKFIKKKLSSSNLPGDYLQLFLNPYRPTLLQQQKREIIEIIKELTRLKILDKINKLTTQKTFKFLKNHQPEAYKKIKAHISKYQWFGMMHMWGEPFSEEIFLEQVKNISAPKTQEKKVNLPKELKWLQKHTQKLSYWRNYVAEICGVASYMALNKLEEASKIIGLSYSDTMWLAPQEFLDSLQKKKTLPKKTIEKRRESFGLIMNNGKIIISTGENLKQYINYALEKIVKNKKVKGTVANKGKAKGVARIVLSPNEIGKVRKGDIMIASETTPDFVPAAYRAAALVTDIGGITSHAAIISREIGLPCIVGTKNATRIFKDGDLIEVNANKGTIVKLK